METEPTPPRSNQGSCAVGFTWNKITKDVTEESRSRTGYFALEISQVMDAKLGILLPVL